MIKDRQVKRLWRVLLSGKTLASWQIRRTWMREDGEEV